MAINLHKAIYSYLLQQQQSGIFSPGEKNPSRNNFIWQFSCARATIDKAIKTLEKKEILKSVHGEGTFICSQAEPEKQKKRLDFNF